MQKPQSAEQEFLENNMDDASVQFGTFRRRSYAFSIDSILSTLIFVGIYFVWDSFFPITITKLSDISTLLDYLMIFLLFYCAIPECLPGFEASIGKYLLNLKVVDYYGQRIGIIRSIWRNIIKVLSSIILLPFLVAAFHPKKRALHDIMSGTYVVRKNLN